MTDPAARLPRRAGLALAGGFVVALALGLGGPGFADYEGRYAEVAREMLLSGDWISPRLDFTLFLNKPPLLYWLVAAAFRVFGPSEWARLVSVLAGAATVLATVRLGARWWGERTGLVAGVLLATTLGFAVEARQLRPDTILAACVTIALACWAAADAEPRPGRRAAWLAALWAVLGIGILAKGFVASILAGVPICVGTIRRHGVRAGIGRLGVGPGLLVLAAIVVPWHVAVALRHPGFAWDYVVNQHLLFFLDRKFPRDSVGIDLATFWGAFVGRGFPWVLLVPLAAAEGGRGLARTASRAAEGSALAWLWMAGVLGLFSLTPSRLEHYTVPALPPLALLAARGLTRLTAAGDGRRAWAGVALAGTAVAATGALVLVLAPRFLPGARLTAEAPGLQGLVLPAGGTLVLAGLCAVAAARRRSARGVALALGAGGALMIAVVVRAQAVMEPLFSWRPVAALLRTHAADAAVVFEAPEEYQLVGGLAFYTARPILLLEPPGFVAPTYLEGHLDEVFLPRAEFRRRWAGSAPIAFVSDPQRWRPTPDGLVPPPYEPLGRSGYRWVLVNARRPDGSTH